MYLGEYPATTLKQAREETLRLKAELEKGNDPRIVKKLEKKANIEVITVNGLLKN
ncbi:Arm DNA-binding domain-containing protein [Parashewanella spongiae]|uniref:Arm DNA-binding domain-containing protein n=1 Tax=Parashewanella spongiae TaxID=342950 RepID=UPI003C73BBDF